MVKTLIQAMFERKKNILLDTDIGSDIDDAIALTLALNSQNIRVNGITTVTNPADKRAKIAQRICKLIGKDPTIAIGLEKPIGSPYKPWQTGREGEGILTEREENQSYCLIKKDGIDYLISEIEKHPKRDTIVTIGPLTNIATAITHQPSLKEKIKNIYAMAGHIHEKDPTKPGEIEYNIASDVDAAKIVVQSGIPITLFPLNVTTSLYFFRNEFNQIPPDNNVRETLKKMTNVWFNYRDEKSGQYQEYICLHDPLVIAALNDPSIMLRRYNMPIKITNAGRIKLDEQGSRVQIISQVDTSSFKTMIWKKVYGLPNEQHPLLSHQP